jgi:hypothetical protein
VKLEAFRVQNYKRIEDTGWVTCHDLGVLVGKNEAGKSAVLRGLSKINPSDEEPYDGLREFPRHRYTSEFASQDWPVASIQLRLDEDDRANLGNIAPELADVTTAEVTRRYSGHYLIGFTPDSETRNVTKPVAVNAAEEARKHLSAAIAPDGRGEELRQIKERANAAIQQRVSELPEHSEITVVQAEALLQAVTQFINEAWQQDCLAPAAEPLHGLHELTGATARHVEARRWIVANMPQFIYFDRYDVLDSAIHIPAFLQQLASTPHAPRVRTTHCLMRNVGLDLKLLNQLGQHQPGSAEDDQVRRQIDERAIRTSSASQAMTREFAEWWLQRRHTFRYQVDGQYMRVWVSDDLNPSEIELDQRSAGMQYFFSFFLVFLVEAEDAHVNSILLLDEPGTSLHGTAQAKIVEFLHKLSEGNQVIYTTHSPFMIDADHLELVRPVYEDPSTGETKISEDVWPRGQGRLVPTAGCSGLSTGPVLVHLQAAGSP